MSGTCDCQLTSAMYRWKCLYISWVTLPALLYRLPNVTAYCTHVNMLWHKEEYNYKLTTLDKAVRAI